MTNRNFKSNALFHSPLFNCHVDFHTSLQFYTHCFSRRIPLTVVGQWALMATGKIVKKLLQDPPDDADLLLFVIGFVLGTDPFFAPFI